MRPPLAQLSISRGTLARGEITVGDFALFASYLFFAAHFPAMVGSYLSEIAQERAVLDRLQELQPEAPPESLVAAGIGPTHAWERQEPSVLTTDPNAPLLAVHGLTSRFPGGGGVEAVDMELPLGSMTVITGAVGAGKTTLLRALLGLLPRDRGDILWRGHPVADPASFFVPPRSAYTPQVPRLFSETLRENILLGAPASEEGL